MALQFDAQWGGQAREPDLGDTNKQVVSEITRADEIPREKWNAQSKGKSRIMETARKTEKE